MTLPVTGNAPPSETVGILISPGSPPTHILEAVLLYDILNRLGGSVERKVRRDSPELPCRVIEQILIPEFNTLLSVSILPPGPHPVYKIREERTAKVAKAFLHVQVRIVFVFRMPGGAPDVKVVAHGYIPQVTVHDNVGDIGLSEEAYVMKGSTYMELQDYQSIL